MGKSRTAWIFWAREREHRPETCAYSPFAWMHAVHCWRELYVGNEDILWCFLGAIAVTSVLNDSPTKTQTHSVFLAIHLNGIQSVFNAQIAGTGRTYRCRQAIGTSQCTEDGYVRAGLDATKGSHMSSTWCPCYSRVTCERQKGAFYLIISNKALVHRDFARAETVSSCKFSPLFLAQC